MTLSEFKSWFEGFTEAMGDMPSPEQWERVKQRVSEIDNYPMPQRVIERHYQDNRTWWPRMYEITSYNTCSSMAAMGSADAKMISGGLEQ